MLDPFWLVRKVGTTGLGAASGVTTYNYDAVGNLQNFAYPNGVTHAYTYDALNRLTQMGASKNSTAISMKMGTDGSDPFVLVPL